MRVHDTHTDLAARYLAVLVQSTTLLPSWTEFPALVPTVSHALKDLTVQYARQLDDNN